MSAEQRANARHLITNAASRQLERLDLYGIPEEVPSIHIGRYYVLLLLLVLVVSPRLLVLSRIVSRENYFLFCFWNEVPYLALKS